MVVGGIAITTKAIAPLTKGFDTVLPYRAWIPYNLDNRISFWLTYLLETIGSFSCGEATIAIDAFAMAMMLQLCAQLDILMYRIQKYARLCRQKSCNTKGENIFIGSWVQHHQSMYM